MTGTPDAKPGRCAVIFNPIKTSDQFRDIVGQALNDDGWVDTLWLETAEDDPGKAMTKQAVTERVDLVIGAGGDGTIRVLADGLAGTGIPLGLIPAGTGNLLARNLGLPLNEILALGVALGGLTRKIDLIKLYADDNEPQHFAVMAGVGVDAVIMDETDDDLKKKIGPAAYFVAASKALGRVPLRVTIAVDDHRPRKRQSMICLIGNVGDLVGNITLIPEAKPDDGLLNIYVASPQRFTHWFKLLLRLITRKPTKDDQVDLLTGKSVTITLRGAETYQIDGDVIGSCTRMRAEVQPGALTICVPAEG